MSKLKIKANDIPSLEGKVALVAGGASGIGISTARLLLEKGATIHIVDFKTPDYCYLEARDWEEWPNFHVHLADVRSWNELQDAFIAVGPVDFVFANAGIADVGALYLVDDVDENGRPRAPDLTKLDTNCIGVLYTVKLAHYFMRKHQKKGSIVITGSSVIYWPDEYVPLGSAAWGALSSFQLPNQLNIVRALRDTFVKEGITINGVAVFAAVCKIIPKSLGMEFARNGVPVSEAHDPALAMVYSAVAREERRVDIRVDEPREALMNEGRWNGRVIQVMLDGYMEMEQSLMDSRDLWFGERFAEWLRGQRLLTLESLYSPEE